jgi:hypothetical protein
LGRDRHADGSFTTGRGKQAQKSGKLAPHLSNTAKSDAGQKGTLRSSSDRINKDVLEKMREAFSTADKDSSGELSPEEFVQSFVGM